LIDVMEASLGDKRRLISDILTGVVQSLSQAGLIQASPEQIMVDLQTRYRARKAADYIERCRLALESDDGEIRRAAVAKLIDISRLNVAEAKALLLAHQAREKDPNIKAFIEAQIGLAKPAEQPLGAVELEKMSKEQRLRLFATLDKPGLAKIRTKLPGFLKKSDIEEKCALIQALGRVGQKEDGSVLEPNLSDGDPQVLSAAIEAIRQIDRDALFPYLPKLIQHHSDEVRVVALRVFALFDKKQALALIEKMLFALQPKQRNMAVFCAGHIDFPSVREMLLKGLRKETDHDNFQQIGQILKANLDEDVFVGIAGAHRSAAGGNADWLESLMKETARLLVKEKKTAHATETELKSAVNKRLDEEESRTKAAQPSYSLSNIQKMRQQQSQAVGSTPKIDPDLARFALVAFSIGAVLTAIIWFVFLAPSDKTKKGSKPVKGPTTPVKKEFSTDPVDISGTITFVDRDEKGFYVKTDKGEPVEYHVTFEKKPKKGYERGKHFKGQVKPVKQYGDTIQCELLMSY